ncbi:MAG: ankyrin repeat domain-containing protein [Rhodocyclaceae bacterium]|nr:ankyrin repeat domain-containing protein [Rhodocyclaceae bacterium]
MNKTRLWFLIGLSALGFAFYSGVSRAASLPDAVEFGRVIELGDVAKARAWLDAGLSPDFEGKPIGTGLMIAAWTGNLPMMALFVERGADINKSNALGEQALLHAAWKGQRAAVEWLLTKGATPKRDGPLWAALHYAAFAGHGDIVKLLLARGGDVNALSPNGSTPLMMAAREGHETVAVTLLQSGADPSVTNEWGDNAEAWALRQNNTSIARLVASSDPALRKPVNRGLAPRSQPVPDIADRLLARARILDAQGRRSESLKLYQSAMTAIRRAEQDRVRAQARKATAPPRQVAALKITARRSNPEEQRASLHYDRPGSGIDAQQIQPGQSPGAANGRVGPLGLDGGRIPQVGAGGTAIVGAQSLKQGEAGAGGQVIGAQDPVERLLAEARQLDAMGKRGEALKRYRQAAKLLKQF